jgi:hypothetical protein
MKASVQSRPLSVQRPGAADVPMARAAFPDHPTTDWLAQESRGQAGVCKQTTPTVLRNLSDNCLRP